MEEHVLIEVKHLTKKYGSFTAVKDISFTVEKGRIYGFLGPNGAGKSTTMNIITGCLAATSGEVTVNGHDIYEEPVEAKASIGYLPEIPPLYTDMTPEEFLYFVGEAKGVDPVHLDVQVEQVMEKTALTGVRDRLIKNLSKGYKQRVGIAQAILGDPEIIILDEPTVGLDPLQIIEIRDLIKELGENHTVILSSHILSEISAVCDTIIIISHGRIVASDTIENLTASADGRRLITLDIRGAMDQVQDALAEMTDAVSTTVTYGMGGCVRAVVETPAGTDMREELFRLFAKYDLPIVEMSSNDVSLEDVFLRLTEDRAEDEEDIPGIREAEEALTEEAEVAGDETEEEEDSPYYDEPKESKASKKSKDEDDSDDYKPLFGGKQ
ncbi:MAG: ATP-binding cassette domain-containing protein [Ruminococcaceae bacterium]|nr:ATP-binding cassette domain-containing protein [Oscillospiraceae bacterium]